MRHSFAALALFAITCTSEALPDNPVVKTEINHLLQFIESSNCIYIRNEREYSGADAVKHISRKYKHFFDEITTAEDFIELSASHSSLTGKDYAVRCGTTDVVKAEQWLLSELHAFRGSQ